MKITTVSKLKIGQKFQWIPDAWYGTGTLISKTRNTHIDYSLSGKPNKWYTYDLIYDALVVNPPARDYGVDGSTKVKLIGKKG